MISLQLKYSAQSFLTGDCVAIREAGFQYFEGDCLGANGLVVYNSITYVIKRIKHEYDKQRTARDKRPRKRDTE